MKGPRGDSVPGQGGPGDGVTGDRAVFSPTLAI